MLPWLKLSPNPNPTSSVKDRYPTKPPAEPPNSSFSTLLLNEPPFDLMVPLFMQVFTKPVRSSFPSCTMLPAMPPAWLLADVISPKFEQRVMAMLPDPLS